MSILTSILLAYCISSLALGAILCAIVRWDSVGASHPAENMWGYVMACVVGCPFVNLLVLYAVLMSKWDKHYY